MDLTIIADLLGSINPIALGSVAGGLLVMGGVGIYVKRNKNKFIENTDPLSPSNDFKTLKTEDLEREFGSLTVQTKMLDEDESLFFDKTVDDNIKEPELTQPSTKLVDEASVFDSFGKQQQAIESLKKAIDIEKHDKEKVRLKILLSQYNNKKGKVSLDEIIKEYPSFHTKVSFGPDNTVSALMSSPVPKSDDAVKTNVNKEINKNFDIFADLPVLSDTPQSPEPTQKVDVITQQKNIFDDLPSLDEVSINSSQNSTPVIKDEPLNLFEEKNEPVLATVTSTSPSSHDIFDDLPSLETHVESVSVAPQPESAPVIITEKKPVEPLDQFSWTTSTPAVEDETEKMLKELQKDADKIDQVNENEAIDDMQRFWKEFGSMVVDIKNEVSANHTLTKNEVISEVQSNTALPVEEKTEPFIPELSNNIPQLVEEPVKSVQETVVEPPVLNDVLPEEPQQPKPPVQVAPVDSVKQNPQVFKVWANWIVNIEGQQVFRNHFVTLKNPWGTAKAGEELYMGINKLSGKTPAGKSYPWVLVSVFPLASE